MRNASPRFNDLHTIRALKRLYFVALICLAAISSVSAQGKQQTINGYAEYYKNGVLIVEGQRIVANQSTVFKKVPNLAGVPLGFEVKVKGVRQPDGSFLATQLEAKQNGMAMFEHDALSMTTAVENHWVSNGMMLMQGADGGWQNGGQIISDGPGVDRVRNIMARLLPPYIRPDRVRVRLIENESWNASAMANGAIWVHTSFLRDMSDDELAVILGHELAHFTHEHTRRQMKQQMWVNLAAAAAGGVTNNQTAQQYMALGFSAWRNGYSRDHEDQADRVGLRYAYEGGFDVEKGSRVWLRMLERLGESDKLTNLISGSHTRPSERYAHLQTEISVNYTALPRQPSQPLTELAGTGGPTVRQPSVPTGRQTEGGPAGGETLVPAASAITTPRPVGRGTESLVSSTAPQPSPVVAVQRPLPLHVVRNAAGKLFPASGYEWVNPTAPNDLRVRLMHGLVSTEDSKFRPASGYEWVNPTAPKDFRVRVRPGLIKTEDGFRLDKGYRWINPKDPNDLRVEPLP
ncbi:MAG: M48 family metalloprotease [Acidobacteria bacterium]|nr:M48 family metalloprotease [Acidobacteriota bacterium]